MTPPDADKVAHLIALMARLPGLGPRSARRAVLHLLKKREALMGPLAELMAETARETRVCEVCGNLSTTPVCPICRDPRRDAGLICVVADVADLWALERAEVWRGRYHVLGGLLSALDGIGPEELGIERLSTRAAAPETREIVLALPATLDGQTTAHLIADSLPKGPTVTTLARGVPVGGELDWLDEGTLDAALRRRSAL